MYPWQQKHKKKQDCLRINSWKPEFVRNFSMGCQDICILSWAVAKKSCSDEQKMKRDPNSFHTVFLVSNNKHQNDLDS